MPKVTVNISKVIKILRIIVALIILASTVVLAYSFYQYQQVSDNVDGSDLDEVVTLMEQLEQHIILPEETPIVATVSDKDLLTDPFFDNAENGDKVLFFVESKLAILFRPSIDKIVAVSPLSENTNNQQNEIESTNFNLTPSPTLFDQQIEFPITTENGGQTTESDETQ
jgi:hypothetical protein